MADIDELRGGGRRLEKGACRSRGEAPADAEWRTAGLWEILQPKGGRPVALVGAGGKSAAVARLIGEWRDGANRGAGLIATVTTRLKAEQAFVADRVVYTAGSTDLPTARADEALLVAGQPVPAAGKIDGIAPDAVCDLAVQNPDTPIVVEADGAAGAMVKVPGPHEPVIPPCAATVVAVIAFPALARAIERRAIHRYDRFTELFGAGVSVLSPDVIARLITHPDGSFRGAPDGARRYWLINQVAGDEAFQQARAFADELCARLFASGAPGAAGAPGAPGRRPGDGTAALIDGMIDGVIVGALQSDRPLWYRPLMYRSVTRNTEET